MKINPSEIDIYIGGRSVLGMIPSESNLFERVRSLFREDNEHSVLSVEREEYTINTSKNRIMTYRPDSDGGSIICQSCGLIGNMFLLERNVIKRAGYKMDETPHLNLYHFRGDDYNRKENWVLMTSDHILPRSRGGSDHYSNRQCLCFTCNNRKGNRIVPNEMISSLSTANDVSSVEREEIEKDRDLVERESLVSSLSQKQINYISGKGKLRSMSIANAICHEMIKREEVDSFSLYRQINRLELIPVEKREKVFASQNIAPFRYAISISEEKMLKTVNQSLLSHGYLVENDGIIFITQKGLDFIFKYSTYIGKKGDYVKNKREDRENLSDVF
jgi:hypothetical protein